MFGRTTSRNFIAPRRQARKEGPLAYFSELGALCAFARVTVISDLVFIPTCQICLPRHWLLVHVRRSQIVFLQSLFRHSPPAQRARISDVYRRPPPRPPPPPRGAARGVLGMDGRAEEKEGVGRGVEMPLGSWDALGGAAFGGSAMGCSGFNGPSGRAGRSGNEISSPL